MLVPKQIVWHIDLKNIQSPKNIFSTRTYAKISSSIKKIEKSEYEFKIEPFSIELIEKFSKIYNEFISKKINGKVFDIKAHLNAYKNIRTYFFFSLYKGDTLIGASIFSEREKSVNEAYKVLPHKLPDLNLQIGLGFIATYNLVKFALNKKKEYVSLGKDRNIYGINSNSGLAMFKIQVSGRPHLVQNEKTEIEFIQPQKNLRDILVFHGADKGKEIINATLYLYETRMEQIDNKYGVLFKSGIKIKVINMT